MPKAKYFKRVGRRWSFLADFNTKYLNWTPSIATVYKGHIWPIGLSIKWLWFGVTFVYISPN